MIVIPQAVIRANLDYQKASFLIEDGFRMCRAGLILSPNRKVFDVCGDPPSLD
jgi:hypothetical protein